MKVNQLTQELHISRQRESVLENRLEQVANMADLVNTIAEGQTRLIDQLVRSRGKELTFVDNRGIAKPEKTRETKAATFNGKRKQKV